MDGAHTHLALGLNGLNIVLKYLKQTIFAKIVIKINSYKELHMKKVQQGFTLIELMIVVAIIGILAAVAIPSYQDYTKRAHVSEGFGLASAAKTGVAEYYASEGVFPTNNDLAGVATAASISGNAVTSVGIGAAGVVTITYNTKVDAVTGSTVTLTPTDQGGSMTWICAGDVATKLRPANCR